ncbi:MAG: hypothetical protein PHT94_03125 [Candidatus Nanoarchaeia archaeon]|nr:hypothetical protein [Candidatus Nanoarchaeia archaeon]
MEKTKKELETLSSNEAFRFVNGVEARSLEEFLGALKIIDSNTFFYHIDDRNDYANWIRGVYEDNLLADKVEASKDRISIHDVIEERLEELKKYFLERKVSEETNDEIASLKNELKKELLELEESLKNNLEKDLEKEISKDINKIEKSISEENKIINTEISDLEKEMLGLKENLQKENKSMYRDLKEEYEDNSILTRAVEFLIGVGFGMIIMYIIQKII